MKKQPAGSVKVLLFALLFGSVFAWVSAVFLGCLFSVLISKGVIGEDALPHLFLLSQVAAGLAGGLIAYSRVRKRALLVCFSTALLSFFLQFLVGIAVFRGTGERGQVLAVLLSLLLGGLLSGILCLFKKKRRK